MDLLWRFIEFEQRINAAQVLSVPQFYGVPTSTVYLSSDPNISGAYWPNTKEDIMSTFQVGDTVKSQFSDNKAVVEYGPFFNNHYGSSYLVKLLEGDKRGVSVPWEQIHMRPVPRFKVGDRVTAESYPLEVQETHTGVIQAGPFKDMIGKVRWIVRVDFDWDFYATEDRMELVEEPADTANPFEIKSNTYEYDGIVYEMGAEYQDRDGDTWKFKLVEGEAYGLLSRFSDQIDQSAEHLSDVVFDHGPLTLVS